MASFSLSQRTSVTFQGQALWELRTTASVRAVIYEIGLQNAGASTGQIYGLARPTQLGTAPTNVTVLNNDGNGPAGNTVCSVTWASPPLLSANQVAMLRRVPLTGNLGAGVLWSFPRGLVIPVSSSIAIFNIGLGSGADVWVELDEK